MLTEVPLTLISDQISNTQTYYYQVTPWCSVHDQDHDRVCGQKQGQLPGVPLAVFSYSQREGGNIMTY